MAVDTFNRADNSSTLGTASDGGTWTISGAAVYGILSNHAYLVSGALISRAASRDTGSLDLDVSVTGVTRTVTTGKSFLWAPFSASNANGYALRYDSSTTIELGRVASGAFTVLATLTGTAWTGGSTSLRVTFNHTTALLEAFQDTGSGWVSLGTVTGSGITLDASYTQGAISSTDQNSTTGETWDSFSATAPTPPAGPPKSSIHAARTQSLMRAAVR